MSIRELFDLGAPQYRLPSQKGPPGTVLGVDGDEVLGWLTGGGGGGIETLTSNAGTIAITTSGSNVNVDIPWALPALGANGQVLAISGGQAVFSTPAAQGEVTAQAPLSATPDGTDVELSISPGSDCQVLTTISGNVAWLAPAP